jgi:rhamnogalacturonyl hydrolase YesR
LATRFKPSAGVIRSWDHGPYGFPVIIDNMMNLELLFEASKFSGDNRYSQIAIKHANNTIIHHFRSDFSSYHVIDYDTATGMPNRRITNQGYSDESAWARGQAWGLYGFTVMYRYTKNPVYLHQARKIADFVLNHPNMPKDKVPYWDYNDPAIPDANRDASASAIIASALLELKNYVSAKENQAYFGAAETILTSLASPAYTAVPGTNKNFIIKHCVGNMPRGRETGEVNTSINYAEYYYIEALLRYKAAMQTTMKTK